MNEPAIEPGALVPVEVESDLTLRRAPDVVLAEAQKAAAALQDVIAKAPRKVVFNGKQYIEAEHWMLVARFYGIAAKVVSSTYVEYGKARGFEARAVAIRVADGQEISAADAMCLDDEPTWSKKPLFQLKSMAQTRACAKALRNVLAWVVVLAGYAPTPAEEIQNGGQSTATGFAKARGERTPAAGGPYISEPQRRRLFAISRQAGHNDSEVQQWLASEYQVAMSREIPRNHYDAIVKRLEDSTPLFSELLEPEVMPDADEIPG